MSPDPQAVRRSGLPDTGSRLAPTAEAWRDFGLATLTTRYDVLLKRATRRKLSPHEEGELRGIAFALDALQLINPEGVAASERPEADSASRAQHRDIADSTTERQ